MIDIAKERQDFDDAFDAAWPDQDTYHPSYREVVWDGWKLRAEHQSILEAALIPADAPKTMVAYECLSCKAKTLHPIQLRKCGECSSPHYMGVISMKPHGEIHAIPQESALIEKIDAAMEDK